MPFNGYRATDRQSLEALHWLKYVVRENATLPSTPHGVNCRLRKALMAEKNLLLKLPPLIVAHQVRFYLKVQNFTQNKFYIGLYII